MPRPEELPEELTPLTRINALSVRHAYFDHDLELLIDALLQRRKPRQAALYLKRHPVQATALRLCVGFLAGFVLLIVAAAVHGVFTQRSLEESLGGPGPVWMLIGAILMISAGGAWFLKRPL